MLSFLKRLLFVVTCFAGVVALAAPLGGYNLTEIGDFYYDASIDPSEKTSAQILVDRLYDLGVRHVILNPRAVMRDPRGNEIIPVTPAGDRAAERQRYMRFIRYVHSKGMSVGFRPIFFVVDEAGNPYRERLPDGSMKLWWHGNIQPQDPNKWFESFRTYLDSYLLLAKVAQVKEFTIGAELYSMTVGIEDQWAAHPHGFPGRWLELLRYARSRLAPGTRIMYDINFTDEKVSSGSVAIQASGGELERWRYRLADLAWPADADEAKIWKNLVDFWTELDAVGIDMYRSLASRTAVIPQDYDALVSMLTDTSSRYATQVDNTLTEIELTLGVSKTIYFKEVGFKSVNRSFIDPFAWDESDPTVRQNILHQAAAMESIFQAFQAPGWDWFGGISFWDISMDPQRHDSEDKGFSPLGKKATEDVLLRWFAIE